MRKNIISKEQAMEICAKVTNIADFCRAVGWQPRGDNYKIFHKYVEQYGLDTSHFTGCRTNIGNRLNARNKLTDEEFFVRDTKNVKSSVIIKRLIDGNYKTLKCDCCGLTDWLNKPITLQLHHINGDHFDNRLENLQLLCPNCHSQTDSYSGKKNRLDENGESLTKGKCYHTHKREPTYTCSKCGKRLERATKSGMCKVCYNEWRSIEKNCPSKEELQANFLKYQSYLQLSKLYNVSDKTIAKWMDCRGLKKSTSVGNSDVNEG